MGTKRQPKKSHTKKSQKKKSAQKKVSHTEQIKGLLTRLVVVLVFLFAIMRMGAIGVTIYNLLRVMVGSTALLVAVVGVLITVFYHKIPAKAGRYSGLICAYAGLLLIFCYMYMASGYQDVSLMVKDNLSVALKDLFGLSVTYFLGGGLVGDALFVPVSFLLSPIGALLFGIILCIIGLFMMSPWTVEDVLAATKRSWTTYQQHRIARQEEKERQAIAQRQEEMPYAHADASQLKKSKNLEEANRDVPIITAISQEALTVTLADNQREEADQSEADLDFAPKVTHHGHYNLPPISLFPNVQPMNQEKEKELVRHNIAVLEDTFKSFGIKATVDRAEIGPSVTKYEVKPAVGISVKRISNLADDLALALAAKDVRIEAPIPGKSLVGIEVPNMAIATVSFRELWESSKTDPDKLLQVPLGKAVDGSSRSFDLAKMPHLLVAGSTGSGKSVAVNGIITSILMKATPDQVKFMMIDPKMVELSVYNDIPHLLIPVVTNPRKAARALQKIVDEMERRYELFAKSGVRNLEGFNQKVADYNSQGDMKEAPLPLIVVIVDELADLMMVASKEVEDAIIRLGQKARAAGIHMILATQRPSVDVISGLIKANVPSRIAFAVSSGTDSRTILDVNGAEKLLGRGDMLFKPIDENHPIRLQGSFISDSDVESIVSFIKGQARANYDEAFDPGEVSESDSDAPGSSGSQEMDSLLGEAKEIVLDTQKASASMLQRRLNVGFNRATRLMEQLEEAGVIGPAEGTKPRRVLQQSDESYDD